MWIWISGLATLPRDIYIAVYYFLLASSKFAIHSDSVEGPYLDLYAGIIQYSVLGRSSYWVTSRPAPELSKFLSMTALRTFSVFRR